MILKRSFVKNPDKIIHYKNKEINFFNVGIDNIDPKVVEGFGEEWLKFNDFNDENLKGAAAHYFDIIDESIVNKGTYALDIGCGTGRWTRYLADRIGFIEAVDPSDAIYAAAKVLENTDNVRLSRASVETLPFEDETFDFAMSIGVLHHIPDTAKALKDCVKKVKTGGHFFVYLYYNFDRRGWFFKGLFKMSDALRNMVSKLPATLKKFICDLIAVFVYLPFVLLIKFLVFLGFKKLAMKMPLSTYYDKPFLLIRNDALDRFGTRLEQRFSAAQIKEMMENAGLVNIVISDGVPFYHAVGKKA